MLPRDRPPLGRPLEPPGDHEVEGQEEIALEREDDPLAEPAKALDDAPAGLLQGRVPRLEQGDRSHPDLPKRGPDDPGLERVQVSGDLREFGQIV